MKETVENTNNEQEQPKMRIDNLMKIWALADLILEKAEDEKQKEDLDDEEE